MALGPYSSKGSGELGLVRRLLEGFRPGDVMLADALYCNYFLIATLMQAASLGLVQTTVQPSEAGLLPVGMARGIKRTEMLCLRVQGHMTLVVGAAVLPLADVIGFEDQQLHAGCRSHSPIGGCDYYRRPSPYARHS